MQQPGCLNTSFDVHDSLVFHCNHSGCHSLVLSSEAAPEQSDCTVRDDDRRSALNKNEIGSLHLGQQPDQQAHPRHCDL